jgi:hypothetical protein
MKKKRDILVLMLLLLPSALLMGGTYRPEDGILSFLLLLGFLLALLGILHLADLIRSMYKMFRDLLNMEDLL